MKQNHKISISNQTKLQVLFPALNQIHAETCPDVSIPGE